MVIRNILLIDDDPEEFEILKYAVHRIDPGIRVYYVDSFFEKPKDIPCDIPDIAFLDINMPRRNGFAWLARLRELGYSFPIIMYSTSADSRMIRKAYETGADLYLQKPNSGTSLIKMLKCILALDWDDPASIKEKLIQNGMYSSFNAHPNMCN